MTSGTHLATRAGRAVARLGDTPIPAAFRDLADRPPVAALTTVMPDGSPQTSVVWCDSDGELLRINCMRGFQKERNMRRDPRVTVVCFDPARPLRWLEVRGTVVAMTEEGAAEHLDALASGYLGRPVRYFGGCVPAEFEATEVPVLCLVRPDTVVTGDWSSGRGATASGGPVASGALDAMRTAREDVPVPASHLDLFERPVHAVLTTLMRDGQPRSSLVWVDYDGSCARFNTTLERRKGRDMAADPRVSLLVVDPDDTSRYVQVRGTVELVRDGAEAHLDALTRRFTDAPAFYGHVYPVEQRARETRVVGRIHAHRVTLDAIHR